MKTLYESIFDIDANIDDLDKSILIGGHYEFDCVNCRGGVKNLSQVKNNVFRDWVTEKGYKKINNFKELYLNDWREGSEFICIILNTPIDVLNKISKFKSYIWDYICRSIGYINIDVQKDYFIISFEDVLCENYERSYVYFRFKKIKL